MKCKCGMEYKSEHNDTCPRCGAEPLKPCPFCGSEDLYVSEDDNGVARWVSCNKCECDGPLGSKLVDPVAWWNNRP